MENLGKRYRVGRDTRGAGLLAERLALAGVRSIRRLRGAAVEHLEREERWLWALRGVTFDVRFGETLGIVGRNGAGKSTLLKLLSQITVPTEGRITRYGRVTGLLEVGTGFHPELTGRENVFLNASLLGMSRRETSRRFDEIVEFSGVEEFLDMPVKRYSTGMHMRLAFSVAAHLEPEILLVDEVLSVGDAAFRQKCMAKLRAVTEQGRTVVFVSHGLSSVRELCDRVLLLERGKLEAEGNPAAVVSEYVDRLEHAAHPAEADDDPSERRVPRTAERTGDRRGRLVRVGLRGLDDGPLEELAAGQPVRVSCGYEVREPLSDVVFEIGVATVDGERIATAHSPDGGLGPVSLEPGFHEVVVDLPPQLSSGEYLLQAGMLRGRDGEPIDMVPHAFRLHVGGAELEAEPDWSRPHRPSVQLSAQWHAPTASRPSLRQVTRSRRGVARPCGGGRQSS